MFRSWLLLHHYLEFLRNIYKIIKDFLLGVVEFNIEIVFFALQLPLSSHYRKKKCLSEGIRKHTMIFKSTGYTKGYTCQTAVLKHTASNAASKRTWYCLNTTSTKYKTQGPPSRSTSKTTDGFDSKTLKEDASSMMGKNARCTKTDQRDARSTRSCTTKTTSRRFWMRTAHRNTVFP